MIEALAGFEPSLNVYVLLAQQPAETQVATPTGLQALEAGRATGAIPLTEGPAGTYTLVGPNPPAWVPPGVALSVRYYQRVGSNPGSGDLLIPTDPATLTVWPTPSGPVAPAIPTDPGLAWVTPLTPVVSHSQPADEFGCPVLTRVPAAVVTRGVPAVYRHVFRSADGEPLDLSFLAAHPLAADPLDPAAAPVGCVVVPAGGWADGLRLPGWPEAGGADGAVLVPLPPAAVARGGLFALHLAARSPAGVPVRSDRAVLSVEPSPWGEPDGCQMPTVRSLRQRLLDTGGGDNLRLDDVEFTADEILLAVERPVAHWNEQPPWGSFRHTTADFPYPERWADAAVGYLYEAAAHRLRRNRLTAAVDGSPRDPMDRVDQYEAEARRRLTEYAVWAQGQRTILSRRLAWGGLGSSYAWGPRAGW